MLAIDVHKEYADLVKAAAGTSIRNNDHEFANLMTRIEDGVYLFELNWWVVVLAAILFLGILNLGTFVQMSRHLSESCKALSTLEASKTKTMVAPVSTSENKANSCRTASTIVNIFGLIVALGACFYLGWARMLAARDLREFYRHLESVNTT